MARDPGSHWRPLVEWNTQGSYAKDKFIVHSTGNAHDTAEGIYQFFNRPEVVVESTFIVGKSPADPTLQVLDSSAMADANLNANASGIAVEMCGAADEPFTDWQVSELVRIARWAMTAHPGITPDVCATATSPGFGWHVMFGAPGPWTPVAKVCPGQVRIDQLTHHIFPAIFGTESEYDVPLSPADLDLIEGLFTKKLNDAIAQRTRQVIANGKLPYGLDTLRRHLVAVEDGIGRIEASQPVAEPAPDAATS